MTEQEILDSLAKAELYYTGAKERMAKARRVWVEAETKVIEAKLERDSIKEELRIYRKTTVNYSPTALDLEIQGFRDRNPEVVEYVQQRDGVDEESK